MASDYVTGIAQQYGEHSLERIEASGYWMDLVARRKEITHVVTHTAELKLLREIIADTVSSDVIPVYDKYFQDHL